MFAHKALVLIPKHIGDVTDFVWDISFEMKFNHSVLSSDGGEIMANPMFISASQNTTLVKPLLCWHCIYLQ